MKELKFERVESTQNLTGIQWYAAPVPGGEVLAAADAGGRFCQPCFVPDFLGIAQLMEDDSTERVRAQIRETVTVARSEAQADRLLLDHTNANRPLERQDKKGHWRRLQATHKPKVGDVIRPGGDNADHISLVITEIKDNGLIECVPQ